MRLDRHRPVLGNRADAVALGEQVRALCSRDGDDVVSGEVLIGLRGTMQMPARIDGGRGLRGKRDAGGRLGHQQRLAEFIDGLL